MTIRSSFTLAILSVCVLGACGSSTPDATLGTSTANVDATADVTSTPVPSATDASTAPTPPGTSSSAVSSIAPAEGIWMTETLGGVKLGMSALEVEKVLGKPEKSTPPTEEAATGDWTSSWSYASKGIAVTLAGPKKAGPLHVKQIYTEKGSKMKTGAGIGAGSTKADVEKAYGKDVSKEHSSDDVIMVGPEEYGAMRIGLEKGVVVMVSLGADGE